MFVDLIDFQRNLQISRCVLTHRLRHLEEQKIIQRQLYCKRPARYEYRLTERGQDMYTIFFALRQRGERWLDNVQTPELQLKHRGCGSNIGFTLVCNNCKATVNVTDIHICESDDKN